MPPGCKKALLMVYDRGGGWRVCTFIALCRVYVHVRPYVAHTSVVNLVLRRYGNTPQAITIYD